MYVLWSLFNTVAGSVAVAALIVGVLAFAGVILLLVRQQRLLSQYRHLMTGTSGGNLETLLNGHIANVRSTVDRLAAIENLAQHLEKAGYHSFQHLGVVRYNAFQDTGSDQSFAVALADGQGDGVVLSSLHARDVTRVYAKPLQKWESTHQLTDEEKRAIALACQKQS